MFCHQRRCTIARSNWITDSESVMSLLSQWRSYSSKIWSSLRNSYIKRAISQLILIWTSVGRKYTEDAELCWVLLWHFKLQALHSSYSGNLSPNVPGRLILQEEVPLTNSSEVMHFGHAKPHALKWSLSENHKMWAPCSVLTFQLWFLFSVHRWNKTNKKPNIK